MVSSWNMKLSWNIECSRAHRIAYTLSADKSEGGKVISNTVLRKYFGRTFIRLILLKLRIIRSLYEHDNEVSNYTHFT
jgi:hypothetical protein